MDGIAEVLTRNTVILEENTTSLKEHMYRTDLLEKRVDAHEIPFKSIKWLCYILGLIGTAAGSILAIRQLIG